MAKRKQHQDDDSASLFLKVESDDPKHPNVNADDFLATAQKWLNSLKTFAADQGKQVKWEIVSLRKGSALMRVRPIETRTHKPAAALVAKWEKSRRYTETTGKPAPEFTAHSIAALEDFVTSLPKHTVVYVGNGHKREPITAMTQGRVKEAAKLIPEVARKEYVTRGSLRGRLAILNSWDPAQRSFRLQLSLWPNGITCIYKDEKLVSELGEGFEGVVEVEGLLHYKPHGRWPELAEVERIRVLAHEPHVSLKDLVGILPLPAGQDSVSYVRGLRDAEQ